MPIPNQYFICDICQNLIPQGEIHHFITDDYGEGYCCDECAEKEHLVMCDDCCIYYSTRENFNQHGDVCDECMNEQREWEETKATLMPGMI